MQKIGKGVSRCNALAMMLLAAGGWVACTGRPFDNGATGQASPGQSNANAPLGGSSSKPSWDVNDISVLYPIKSTMNKSDPGSLIRLNEGNGLISQQQFSNLLAVFKKNFALDFSTGALSDSMNKIEKWAVVAFRIHSCFQAKVADPCVPTVNVIAQAVLPNDTNTTDFAMHLVYTPSKSSVELLKDMIRIRETYADPQDRQATIGAKLGIHPLLKKRGGLGSNFAQKLKEEFVLKHLNPQNLKGIAVAYIEPERLQPWLFFKVDAANIQTPKKNSIFMFDPGTSVNSCGVQSGRLICMRDLATGKIIDSAEKAATNPTGDTPTGFTSNGTPYVDDFLTLVQTDKGKTGFAAVKNNLAHWEGVFNKIDNPKLLGPDETNCASCHRTTVDKVRFRSIFNLNTTSGTNAFQPTAGTGCTPGVAIDYSQKGIKTFNVRNFGYLHEDPIISNRVANETLMACEILKKTLL